MYGLTFVYDEFECYLRIIIESLPLCMVFFQIGGSRRELLEQNMKNIFTFNYTHHTQSPLGLYFNTDDIHTHYY